MKNLLFSDNKRPEIVVPLCKKYEVGIEFQSFYEPDYWIQHPDGIQEHRVLLADIKNRSMHGMFIDLFPGVDDPAMKEVVLKRFLETNHIAEELEATDVVLHHHFINHFHPKDIWFKNTVSLMQEFLDSASEKIRFHLENIMDDEPSFLKEIIEAIDRPNLDICLDVGHAHCNSDIPVTDWIHTFGSMIGHVHLHSNHGKTDEHLGLTEGTLPIIEICSALEEVAPDANWVFELSGSEKLFSEALDLLRKNGFI